MTVTLTVKNFRAVEDTEIAIDRTLLYGPNGGGKSSMIHALLISITTGDDPLREVEILGGINNKTEIELRNRGKDSYIRIRGKGENKAEFTCKTAEYTLEEKEIELPTVSEKVKVCIGNFFEELGIRSVGYIRGDKMIVVSITGREYQLTLKKGEQISLRLDNIDDFTQWQALTSHYEIVHKKLRENSLADLETLVSEKLGIDKIYNGYIYDAKKDNWYPISLLAYGQRRMLMFLITLLFSDLLIVEGFENSLHLDYAIEFMNVIRDLNKKAVVETHLGFLIKHGLSTEWNVYYVEEGKAAKLDFDVFNKPEILKLFRRERQAYAV